MKNILFLFLIGFSYPSVAKEIATYDEFLNSMDDGNRYKITAYYDQCDAKGKKLPHQVINFISLNTIVALVDENHFSTHALHFSNHIGREYIRITFSSENKATIQIYNLNPQKLNAVKPTHIFECVLGKGIFIHEY